MTNDKIIVQIDDEDILELIPEYLETRRSELDVLQNAVQQQDFETLRSLGHKLKGSGGGYGLDRISEIGGKLESAAKEKDLPISRQQVADLVDYLNRVEIIGK